MHEVKTPAVSELAWEAILLREAPAAVCYIHPRGIALMSQSPLERYCLYENHPLLEKYVKSERFT